MSKPLVILSGVDGNVFSILSVAKRAINNFNRECLASETIDYNMFEEEFFGGDYDHAIQTVMKYCNVH